MPCRVKNKVVNYLRLSQVYIFFVQLYVSMKQIFLSLSFICGLMLCFSAANAQDDIWVHTPSLRTMFHSGGSILIPQDVMDKNGKGTIGRDCGQYVVPHDALDETLDIARLRNQDGSTCYDISRIEREMGVTDGAWDHKTLIRVNLRYEALHELELRWPSESDCVPYPNWMDGISRCCGMPIGMINAAPADYVVVIDKEIKPCKKTEFCIPMPCIPHPCCIPCCVVNYIREEFK